MSMSDGAGDVEMRDGNENEEHTEEQKPKKVYIPGVSRPLKDNEELEYDPEAYRLFHTFETELPCLSFDVIKDELGENRENYPATCYLVGGTQAEKRKDNQLVIMRLSNMNPIEKEKEDEDSEEGQSSDEEEAEEEREKAKLPVMQAAIIPHYGDVNRVKCQNIGPTPVCAVWNEQGKVQIWNLSNSLAKINASEERNMFSTKMTDEKALYSFNGHSTSGYALGWSPLKEGALASGDSYKNIFLWQMGEGGTWVVDQRALKGHESSVEDLQWSVTEEPLLASCSTDREYIMGTRPKRLNPKRLTRND
ncbi:histone-binding protein RBBP4 or subunit C of CAF1 complex domain-containing protein [Ditylenchus destructor]|uniref:Histone-binding protein RBBP4 or subunit C of CAF1 complex domain-containing protein n=1 Tax=Ditylenchus destructor TaxID=166010 RepID=A0AAD4NGE4_9BILA|nr:histone-binding protein RBBP4 or subunit C of CAF1 complex domain-containing protein [Ditylenchus destructor]